MIRFLLLYALLLPAFAEAKSHRQCAASPLAAYEMLTSQAQQKQARKTNQLININTASVAELIHLPKIGVKKAQAIVDHRLRQGAFTSVDDLTQINGIGQSTLDHFRHRLTIQ